jgi:glycosyl transferase family 25
MSKELSIFVISLKESVQRRKRIKNHLDYLGLTFEWFDAVNGKNLSDSEINTLCDTEEIKKHPIWLSRGAIGCALSHYYLYLEIIKRNLPYALVLEDDIILENKFLPCFDNLVSSLQSSEIVALFYQSKKPLKLISTSKKSINDYYSTYHPLRIGQPLSTGAYVITLDACKSLSKVILPIRFAADSWGYYHELGAFESLRCVYPRPVDSTDEASTIQYRNQNWKFNLKKIIERYKIFPAYHVLLQRRKNIRKKMMAVEMIASPVNETK